MLRLLSMVGARRIGGGISILRSWACMAILWWRGAFSREIHIPATGTGRQLEGKSRNFQQWRPSASIPFDLGVVVSPENLSLHHLEVKSRWPQRLIHALQDESKTLTLIDWGLADDFSGGLARAGKLYLDATGKPPKKGKKAEVPNGGVQCLGSLLGLLGLRDTACQELGETVVT